MANPAVEIDNLKRELDALFTERNRIADRRDDLISEASRQRSGGDIEGAKVIRAQAEELTSKLDGLVNQIGTLQDRIKTLEQQQEKQDRDSQPQTTVTKPEPPTEDPTADRSERSDVDTNPDNATDEEPNTADNQAQDDGPQTTSPTTTVNAERVTLDGPITPQPNILDRFANYTYTAAVYMLTNEQYNLFKTQNRKQLASYNLLFQSGGAPNNTGGVQNGGQVSSVEAGRNPFFPYDYYLDTITMSNNLNGKGTGSCHSVTDLKFTVIEPSNITLIDNLYNAAQNLKPTDAAGAVNYGSVIYLMVIKFYGYDQDGKPVKVGAPPGGEAQTDPNAAIEKFIPFTIKTINWSVSSKLVTYEFDCAVTDMAIATTTRRGTIPADIELSGATVNDMLVGDLVYNTGTVGDPDGSYAAAENARFSNYPAPTATPAAGFATTGGGAAVGNPNLTRQAANARAAAIAGTPRTDTSAGASRQATSPSAPPKATAAATKKAIRTGLIQAMNKMQQDLVDKNIYEYPDEYEIEFIRGAEDIRDALVKKPGEKTNKQAPAMGPSPTQSAQAKRDDTGSIDTSTRNFGVVAGMQLVQAIDLVIRNSSYITNQATVVIDETTNQPIINPRSNTRGMKWYTIIMETTQLKYDRKRNDYAYKIKFKIAPFSVQDFISPYFPLGGFRGVHKKYPWWFTGENIAVLDYQASFNKMYNLTVTGGTPGSNAAAAELAAKLSSGNEIPFVQYQARSPESAVGSSSKANDLGASAAEYLYSGSNNAEAKITIIGDPAWIQQYNTNTTSAGLTTNPFNPDGTINFNASDVLFEIVWQRPEDYDSLTGKADPYARTAATFGNRKPIQSVIYKAIKVDSEFKQGKFVQTIHGSLYILPTTKTRGLQSDANQTDAETQRLLRQNAQAAMSSDPNQTAATESRLGITLNSQGRGSLGNYSGLSSTSVNVAKEAAKFTTYNKPVTRTVAPVIPSQPSLGSGLFEIPGESAADLAAPLAEPEPAFSNGQVVGSTGRLAGLEEEATTDSSQIGSRDY